jgi:DNA-binding XRE family transcriptional regulator
MLVKILDIRLILWYIHNKSINMEVKMMDLATKVRLLRAAKKWSQKELAKKIGVDWTSISSWENGKRFPHYTTAQKIEELYKEAMKDVNKEGKE